MAPPPRTHCVLGHPIGGDNVYVTATGLHKCRTCRTEAARRYEAKRRAKQRAETDDERAARLATRKRTPEQRARYNATTRRKRAAQRRADAPQREQIARALKRYPGVLNADPALWLRDNDTFARIIRDVIRVGLTPSGRRGPRRDLTPEQARAGWTELVTAVTGSPPEPPETRLPRRALHEALRPWDG